MNQMPKTFIYLLVVAGLAAAQPFSAGVKVGVPLTDALNIQSTPSFPDIVTQTHRYAIGPYAELRLPFKLSLEVDALYRSFSFQLAPTTANNSVGSWEFPVMAKYKLWKGPVKPYVAGGLVFSHLSGVKDLAQLNHLTNYGITAGAGLEIHALVLRISPEIRYDGFVFHNFDNLVQSNRNQAMVLVGIGF